MGWNPLKKETMDRRVDILSKWKATSSIYFLASLSKSKSADVEIIPMLSIVKPEPSRERKYCLLDRKRKQNIAETLK